MSVFGWLFMATMASLIRRDYQYLGEWFEPPGSSPHAPSYADQRAAAAANCARVAWLYFGLAVVCVGARVVGRARGR